MHDFCSMPSCQILDGYKVLFSSLQISKVIFHNLCELCPRKDLYILTFLLSAAFCCILERIARRKV